MHEGNNCLKILIMSGPRYKTRDFTSLNREAFLVYGKIHREKASLKFNENCLLSQVIPRYVKDKISKNMRNHRAFTSKKIKKMEMEILIAEMVEITKKIQGA